MLFARAGLLVGAGFYHFLVKLITFIINVPIVTRAKPSGIGPFDRLSISLGTKALKKKLRITTPLGSCLKLHTKFSLLGFGYGCSCSKVHSSRLVRSINAHANCGPSGCCAIPLGTGTGVAGNVLLLSCFPFGESIFRIATKLLFNASSVLGMSKRASRQVRIKSVVVRPKTSKHIRTTLGAGTIGPCMNLKFKHSMTRSHMKFGFRLKTVFRNGPGVRTAAKGVIRRTVSRSLDHFGGFLGGFGTCPILGFRLSCQVFWVHTHSIETTSERGLGSRGGARVVEAVVTSYLLTYDKFMSTRVANKGPRKIGRATPTPLCESPICSKITSPIMI